MATARVAIRRRTGATFFELTITDPADATWHFGPVDHGGVANDPGNFVSYQAWQLGAQSSKVRRLEVSDKRVYVESDYGEANPFDLWLAIKSPTPQVSIRLVKILADYGSEADIYFDSGVDSVHSATNAPHDETHRLRLW